MGFVDLPGGGGYEGEVGVVGLGLGYELLSLFTGDRGEWAFPYRLRPLPVALKHRVDVELGHRETLTPLYPTKTSDKLPDP